MVQATSRITIRLSKYCGCDNYLGLRISNPHGPQRITWRRDQMFGFKRLPKIAKIIAAFVDFK